MNLAVLDLSQPDAVLAPLLRSACEQYGFFFVRNHGVSNELRSAAFTSSRQFFSLPLDEKMQSLADKNNRGYTPMREETLDVAVQKHGDTKEGCGFSGDSFFLFVYFY